MCSTALSSVSPSDETEINIALKQKKQTKCQGSILATEYVRNQYEIRDILVLTILVLDGQYISLSHCDFQSNRSCKYNAVLKTDKTWALFCLNTQALWSKKTSLPWCTGQRALNTGIKL